MQGNYGRPVGFFADGGCARKVPTSLTEVIESVIDMVKPLSKYRRRNICFVADPSIVAVVNEQEMKQVVLNLITNALGSVDENGTVRHRTAQNDGKQHCGRHRRWLRND